MSCRVAELVECAVVVVGEVIASLMVASIIGFPRRSAEDLGLHLSLATFRAGEKPASWNALVNERAIVGASVEGCWQRGKTLAAEIVEEDGLDLSRARRADGPVLGAVTILHKAHRVG